MNNIPPEQKKSLLKFPEINTKNMINSTYNSIKNSTSNIRDISKALYNNSISQIDNITNRPETIIGLIILILLAIIVAYIMYNYISTSVFNQSKLVVSSTKLPVLCNIENTLDFDRNIKSGNGLKRTYTFWIYIKDMSNTGYKNVLFVGNKGSVRERSLQIFLDNKKNKMYIRFRKANEEERKNNNNLFDNLDTGNINEYVNNLNGNEQISTEFRQYMSQGTCIEYIPIQRWVHVGIVVNDYGSSVGGNITTYVDGELVGIAGHKEELRGLGDKEDNEKYDVNNLDLNSTTVGQLVVGGSYGTDRSPGFAGLLSKFTIWNYDLNDRDIYNNYNEGPIDNLLARLGLGAYGLRSPIYRIR
tara:strand:+ start:4313 stop:5389 length:1077 start_codon:yes stop_codon:yes gene_type:complete